MLLPEENDLLCGVEKDAPMARLMPQHWVPVCLVEEGAEPDGTPVLVEAIGRRYVAIRNSAGELGLLDELCPHRRASLIFGRNEENGPRCLYHGWKFDVKGNCIGIKGTPHQEIVMCVSMGAITVRTTDILGASDLAIVEFRSLMVDAARTVAEGGPAIGTVEPRAPHRLTRRRLSKRGGLADVGQRNDGGRGRRIKVPLARKDREQGHGKGFRKRSGNGKITGMTTTQQIGALGVTALIDSKLTFDAGIITNCDAGRVAELLQAAGKSEVQTHCNSYLIRSSDALVLVDAGTRGLFGPTSGMLPEALAEAGVKPSDVTHLFMTHLHPDHVAGAITPDGAAVFPNAELLMTAPERDFWASDANFAGANDMVKGWQALATGTLSAYRDRLRLVADGDSVISGVTVLSLPGHTPGHAGLRIEDGGQTLIHMADVVHVQDVQLADPSLGVVFDVDGGQAQRTRARALDMLATDAVMVTGAHLTAPKFGKIERAGKGYRFTAR